MLCYIKYIDYPIYVDQQNGVRAKNSKLSNKILLVHIFCPIKLIMDYICSEIQYDGDIDLIDLAAGPGQLLHVNKYSHTTPGSEVLTQKQTYYVMHPTIKNGKKIYLPILDIGSEEYSYFTIKRKPNPKQGVLAQTSATKKPNSRKVEADSQTSTLYGKTSSVWSTLQSGSKPSPSVKHEYVRGPNVRRPK
ncbi:uncharacterized protein LOC126264959 [Aethina tumida]|uniref:uncharacterized protein LOC126264959 n=1 Tax=Aethina tumida TaxID=116153 RepID=UPI00214821A4|nr:uncharacterized protein LOC126264959 [Aethina tumida]